MSPPSSGRCYVHDAHLGVSMRRPPLRRERPETQLLRSWGLHFILHPSLSPLPSMTSEQFDFAPLLPAGLPPAAARWAGRVKHDFTGGNNDADALPLDGLIAAANAVMKR